MKNINTTDCGDLGVLFIDKKSHESSTKKMDEKDKMKSTLYAKLVDTLEPMDIDETKLPKDMVDVDDSNAVVRGKVRCVLCSDTDERYFTINSTIKGGNLSWIFSNYLKHLRKEHNMAMPQKMKIKKKKNSRYSKEESASKCSKADQSDKDIDLNVAVETCESTLDIEISDQFFIDCDSNIERMRTVIYDSISTQTLCMLENSESNDEVNHSMVFDCCAERRDLKIVKVKKDGNCIFSAMVHQLYKTNINSENHSILTNKMRANIISFITNNIPLFKTELETRIYAIIEKKGIQNMDEEIQKFLEVLSKDGIWGGAESLKAVQHSENCNILIINESGEFYFAFPFDESANKVLILAYRLSNNESDKNTTTVERNHYDSVVHIEPNDVFTMSEVLVERVKRKFLNISLKNESSIDLTE